MYRRTPSLFWIAVASSLCARLACADVQILIEGEAGAAFNGNRYLLTDANGTVELAKGYSGETLVSWRRAASETIPELSWFNSGFIGPHATRLQIGTYSNVTRLVQPDNDTAAMEVSGTCNRLTGGFEVLDVAYDEEGTPRRLAINVEHHCEGGPRADRIRIRFNSSVPLHPPGVTANAGSDVQGAPGSAIVLDASSSRSTFAGPLSYVWSQLSGPAVVIDDAHAAQPRVSLPAIPGEYAFAKLAVTVRDSQGNEDVDQVTVIVSDLASRSRLSIHTPQSSPLGRLDIESDFDLTKLRLERNFRNGIDLHYTGAYEGYAYQTWLDINWSGPFLNELQEGDYDLAYRHAFAPISKSGLDFTFALGCGYLIGYFTVLDVAYDDLGHVERLAIDLAQVCLDDLAADQVVTSSIRYNSVVPLVSRMPHASAGQDLEMFAGQTVELLGGTSNGGASDIVEYRWRQTAGAPVVLQDEQTATPRFVAPSVPLGGGTFVFELTVRNAAGYEDTDNITVRVLGPQDRRSWIHIEQYASEGCSWLLGTCNGASFTLTRNDGDLRLSGTSNGDNREWVIVDYVDFGSMRFELISEPGTLLAPGRVYLDLVRGDLTSGSFDLGINGRGCNWPRSMLTVHELERDAQDQPISLAADFSIACDGDPPMYGWIRINSTLPKTPSRPLASAGYDQQAVIGDVARLTGASSFAGAGIATYEWTQISGPPVTLSGAGADATFTVPDAAGTLVFRLTVHGTDGSVHSDDVTVTVPAAGTRRSRVLMESSSVEAIGFGRRHEMEMTGLVREKSANSFWINNPWSGFPASMFNLYVYAPFDQPLGPVNYPGVRDVNSGGRANHDIFNAPGMDFDWELWHCLDVRGRFVVHEYVPDPNGEQDRIAVDLIQSCGPDGPLTRAAVRMNSAVPLRTAGPSVSAGPDRVVRSGRSTGLDGRYSISWLDKSLTYSWTQVSGPTVQLSSRTAVHPTFTTPTVTQDVTLRFELAVTDADGLSATDAVNVIVLAPTTPSHDVRVEVSDPRISIGAPRFKPTTMELVGPNLIEHTVDDSYLDVQDNTPWLYLRYRGDVGVYFTFDAYNMRDKRLRPGTWTLTSESDQPAMDIGVQGLNTGECADRPGPRTLRIGEVEYDSSGHVTRLAFAFRIDCRSFVLTGVGHLNSAAAIAVPEHMVPSPPSPTPSPTPPPPSPPPSGGGSSGGGGGASDVWLLTGLAMLGCCARRLRRTGCPTTAEGSPAQAP